MMMEPIVIFGVIAELHKSLSQQTLAITELALNYKNKSTAIGTRKR